MSADPVFPEEVTHPADLLVMPAWSKADGACWFSRSSLGVSVVVFGSVGSPPGNADPVVSFYFLTSLKDDK
ncbi:hypothetical protein DTO166G4_6328 [Paecilomyces variotii]|nr:hypothetical protein DTO164E3_3691 [Paecilomyces variotii]KAJ9212051.1 hypothetical protein DTO166G4_6328 [Paecilomyces variotii]KAJ9220198.1 hypothetical protein DTO169C6_7483 [Paecilomyces variotii]KAJ9232634.1 hypothetical protein DTO169E5_7390 [Paecilomyces variotii]KAJ9241254.1 hypothetical protein DTO166G5_1416 [Paecilomyces variotii]